jgi:hypothetical protein
MKWVVAVAFVAACTNSQTTLDGGREAPDASVDVLVDANAFDVQSEASSDAGQGDADTATLAAHGIEVIEQIAKIIHANATDCDVMAARLTDYEKSSGDTLTQMHLRYMGLAANERRTIQKHYRARFDAAWHELQPGIRKCNGNPVVGDIIRKML